MTYGDINRLAVDLNTVLFGIRNGDILIGRGIVDIFPVMRQVTERKDKRGSHCIVGGVAEGVLSIRHMKMTSTQSSCRLTADFLTARMLRLTESGITATTDVLPFPR